MTGASGKLQQNQAVHMKAKRPDSVRTARRQSQGL